MNATAYKFLGFVVWRGGRWYLRRNYTRLVPSGRTAGAAAGLAALSVAGLALLATRRNS